MRSMSDPQPHVHNAAGARRQCTFSPTFHICCLRRSIYTVHIGKRVCLRCIYVIFHEVQQPALSCAHTHKPASWLLRVGVGVEVKGHPKTHNAHKNANNSHNECNANYTQYNLHKLYFKINSNR